MSFFYQITLRSLVAKIEERMAKILYRKIAESWYCGKIQVKQLSVELFSVDTSRNAAWFRGWYFEMGTKRDRRPLGSFMCNDVWTA